MADGLVARLARLRVPLGFAIGIIVLWLARPTMTSVAAGGTIALVGEGLRFWASGHLNKAREVTSSGPYRWCAHPLYVGSSILGVGTAIASGRALVAFLVALYLASTLTAAIKNEEAYLRRAFGDGYDRYRSGNADATGRFRLSRAVANREPRTIVGILIVLGLLLAKAVYGV